MAIFRKISCVWLPGCGCPRPAVVTTVIKHPSTKLISQLEARILALEQRDHDVKVRRQDARFENRGSKSRTFSHHISEHFDLIWKSPGFDQFMANMIHLWAQKWHPWSERRAWEKELRMSDLGQTGSEKRLQRNGTNPGLFQSQMYRNLIWKKSWICPICGRSDLIPF